MHIKSFVEVWKEARIWIMKGWESLRRMFFSERTSWTEAFFFTSRLLIIFMAYFFEEVLLEQRRTERREFYVGRGARRRGLGIKLIVKRLGVSSSSLSLLLAFLTLAESSEA